MPIPQETEVRRVILDAVKGGNPHNISNQEFQSILSDYLRDQDKSIYKPMIDRAMKYLSRHKLISNPLKDTYMITRKGADILARSEGIIDDEMLENFSAELPNEKTIELHDSHDDSPQDMHDSLDDSPQDMHDSHDDSPQDMHDSDADNAENDYTPDDITEGDDIMPSDEDLNSSNIEDILARHGSELANKVLMRTANLSPETFDALVIDLLSKMGYRVYQNARYTNDDTDNGMIQGVILDTQTATQIYIHVNKLFPDQIVDKSEVQDFVEALADKGGKGIFATSGNFSDNAVSYAQDERIMLIDGKKLAGLMIAHNFCVNIVRVFEVKEIDEDSFREYEN